MSSQEKKTVIGYPVHKRQVAARYPAPSASSNVAPPPSCTHCKSFFHCLILLLFIIAFVSSVIGIGAAVLTPDLPEFRVDSASVSPLTSNRSALTAAWNFTFLVRNPNNRLGISYHNLQASVYYKEMKLNTMQLPPFYQNKRNETTVRAGLGLMGEFVGGDVMKRFLSEKDVGTVRFRVQVFGRIRYRSRWWWITGGLQGTGKHSLRVYCQGLQIGYLDNNGTGILLGGHKVCEVVNPSI